MEECDLAEALSIRLAKYEPEMPISEFLQSEELFFEWDKYGVLDVLCCLAPCNSHIHLISSIFTHTELQRTPENKEDFENNDENDDDDSKGWIRCCLISICINCLH